MWNQSRVYDCRIDSPVGEVVVCRASAGDKTRERWRRQADSLAEAYRPPERELRD